ncbi:hypothetical protein SAMN05216525_13917 [Bradyrhizobium sp. Gha]|nr:hypothetical protein SAMN05216525_13917 [Bradyrhizobium sp. Gha]
MQSCSDEASRSLESEHETILCSKLRDIGKVEHAPGGAGLDQPLVGIKTLLPTEDNTSVIFFTNIANHRGQLFVHPPPCGGDANALDEQHETPEAQDIFFASLSGVSLGPPGVTGAKEPNAQKQAMQ